MERKYHMQAISSEILTNIASFNGIDVYHIKADKFKTSTINIFLHDNLCRENVTKNALLPAVLRRGCKRLATFQDIALYLEELYGASFDCGVVKKGERQILHFYMECVSDKFTGADEKIFEKASQLIYEIMTDPVVEDGGFKSEYMEQEKENLKNLIESRINDKVQYAMERCYEEMCKEEPFGIFEYGSVSDLSGINGNNLYEHYKTAISTFPVSVFITGNVKEEVISGLVEKLSKIPRSQVKKVDLEKIDADVGEIKKVNENINVNQAKLALGFRTYTASNNKDYYPLLVYNGILGGGMHSKLFQNVREKESLAYYIYSRLDKFKGVMIISGGIETGNKEKTEGIIEKQLEDIRNGKISDYEFDSTIKTIETGINSLKDSQMQIVDFYLSQVIVNTTDTLDSIIEKVKKVTKKDVVDVSKKIQLDTVYFLAPQA